ncbi:hypothetical protein [Brumicola pallidula]|uniref:Uncharacterized protein n=1 Tax=Brumicola pallidula DSM 14239 = ACAM 615 TaxID=1121922 RepID=K6YD19_9ALTE|nr:hypothetical protein [Glaciecola pallidula]GAC30639.1 hypothetical protein GPAL_3799 [Glaciecola pallidula DSM 14239 = ACAM 615]
MWLKILIPSRIFVHKIEVLRIVAESTNGSFGILGQRRDCVASCRHGIKFVTFDILQAFRIKASILIKFVTIRE